MQESRRWGTRRVLRSAAHLQGGWRSQLLHFWWTWGSCCLLAQRPFTL